jgi:hypothetical protein
METRGLVDWCTKIPLDTLLERLVTADPAIEVIKRDICASAYLEQRRLIKLRFRPPSYETE